MNFCGIVCEFNPFHNGHEYIISQAKQLTGKDVLCLMSGDFVQRGTPAIESKFERAKKAVIAGANAVLELPCIYACSNAENFATGAIKIFKALNISTIAFGIENTNLELLQKIAKLKHENSERFQTAFKNEIQNGINYNTALKRSIAKLIGDDDGEIFEVLCKPNNILAIEYLTAILKLEANISPVAITRIDNGFNSQEQKDNFLSASSIRALIDDGLAYEQFVPNYAKIEKPFSKSQKETFDTLCLLKIRNTSAETLNQLYDYTEGIEYRIKKMADTHQTLAEVISKTATPRYRLPRVNKLVLYPVLNITKKLQESATTTKPVVKVLAINKSDKTLLNTFNKSKISLVKCNNDYESLTKKQKDLIAIDLNASNIYNSITNKPNNNDKKIGTMFL